MSLKSEKSLMEMSRVEESYYTIIKGSFFEILIQVGGDDVIVIFEINRLGVFERGI